MASNTAALRYYRELSARNGRQRRSALDFRGLLSLAAEGDAPAGEALDKMASQLARGVRVLVAGLAPEAITFIGEFTAAWDRFEPVLKREVEKQTIARVPVLLIPGRDGEAARLRGNVALVLQKHFGVNLAI
jgi:predicted NBD/HSP70 family sugar kinase